MEKVDTLIDGVTQLFDAYLMVDWSANSRPKTGKDSIWWCLVDREDKLHNIRAISNPATREKATSEIRELLLGVAGSGQKILVGFDFAYGYPQGFAHHFGSTDQEAWLNVWQGLARRIEDSGDNSNNRFQVAANLNREISGSSAPFWGCPASQTGEYLGRKKPGSHRTSSFREFRLAEARVRAHSTWKLFYNGSVGSQVLVGLPRLYQLRTHQELKDVSCVWPFETGLKPLDAGILAEKHIVHAEIYPSLIKVERGAGEVKDRAQIQNLGLHFAQLDQDGCLGEMFGGDHGLSDKERRVVEREEGGILGVMRAPVLCCSVDVSVNSRLTDTDSE